MYVCMYVCMYGVKYEWMTEGNDCMHITLWSLYCNRCSTYLYCYVYMNICMYVCMYVCMYECVPCLLARLRCHLYSCNRGSRNYASPYLYFLCDFSKSTVTLCWKLLKKWILYVCMYVYCMYYVHFTEFKNGIGHLTHEVSIWKMKLFKKMKIIHIK